MVRLLNFFVVILFLCGCISNEKSMKVKKIDLDDYKSSYYREHFYLTGSGALYGLYKSTHYKEFCLGKVNINKDQLQLELLIKEVRDIIFLGESEGALFLLLKKEPGKFWDIYSFSLNTNNIWKKIKENVELKDTYVGGNYFVDKSSTKPLLYTRDSSHELENDVFIEDKTIFSETIFDKNLIKLFLLEEQEEIVRKITYPIDSNKFDESVLKIENVDPVSISTDNEAMYILSKENVITIIDLDKMAIIKQLDMKEVIVQSDIYSIQLVRHFALIKIVYPTETIVQVYDLNAEKDIHTAIDKKMYLDKGRVVFYDKNELIEFDCFTKKIFTNKIPSRVSVSLLLKADAQEYLIRGSNDDLFFLKK